MKLLGQVFTPSALSLSVAFAVLGYLLCACGGAGMPLERLVQGQPAQLTQRPRTVSGDLYVVNAQLSPTSAYWTNVYGQKGTPFLYKVAGGGNGDDDIGSLTFDAQDNLYWSDWVNRNVRVFAPGKTVPSYTIVKGFASPTALAVDAAGNLFVTNNGFYAIGYNQSSIVVYARGKTLPSYTITDGISVPNDIALDARGDLFVTNCPVCLGQYAGPSGRGNVVEYAPGKKSPSRVITNGIAAPGTLAFDKAGNLYVANGGPYGNYGRAWSVTEYAPSSSRPSRVITNGIDTPQSLVFDSAGNLYVSNLETGVSIYAPGATVPKQQIPAEGRAIGLAIDRDDYLYVYYEGDESGSVWIFPPGATKPVRKLAQRVYGFAALAIAP